MAATVVATSSHEALRRRVNARGRGWNSGRIRAAFRGGRLACGSQYGAAMEAHIFFGTEAGRRPCNEDRCGIEATVGLFAVADGMGGYEGGEVASQLAVDALRGVYLEVAGKPDDDVDGALLQRGLMSTAFGRANSAVRGRRQGKLSRMGCTLSALVIRGDRALVGHMGDSRVYRLREGSARLQQLTADHSLVAKMRAMGVESAIMEARFGHIITRAIGVSEVSRPDIFNEAVEPGDRYLLCTDGLTDVVCDARIESVLRDSSADAVCSILIREALRGGSEDNVTALLVEVSADPPDPDRAVRERAPAEPTS
jgi:PPM family protein phosphatase